MCAWAWVHGCMGEWMNMCVADDPLERLSQASVANCFVESTVGDSVAFGFGLLWSPISFLWSHVASKGNETPAPLSLDTASSSSRNLRVVGSSLRGRVVYTLRVSGCMVANPTVCGYALTDLMLRDEPLYASIAGGDRTLGAEDPIFLDACVTHDPDDPDAACPRGVCGPAISFEWSCTPMPSNQTSETLSAMTSEGGVGVWGVAAGGACALVAPATSACTWLIGGNSLLPGRFAFAAHVTTATGKSEQASVLITLQAGALPSVTIGALVDRKQNPSSKLRLMGEVALPESAPVGARAELTWYVSRSPPEVELALVR